MGNKHGTLSLGRCRDRRRPDTRSRNWSFHSMDSKRVGSTSKLNATSSVSIHTSGGHSVVKYHARSSSCSKSAEAKAALNRDDVDGCSRAGLMVRSLSAPVQDLESDDITLEPDNESRTPCPSKNSTSLPENNSTISKIPCTSANEALPIDFERLQQEWEDKNTTLEDPWVRCSGRFEVSIDSAKSDIRTEASCRKKLFHNTTGKPCRDSVVDSAKLDLLAKQKMNMPFFKSRSKNKGIVKACIDEKGLMKHKDSTEKLTEDVSSHGVQALSYLKNVWQERFKNSSNPLRPRDRVHNMCASQSDVARTKSTKKSQSTNTLSPDKSENTSTAHPQTYSPPRERVLHFVTNQKGHKGLFANRKILNKNNVNNARLYKSSETIINKSTEATVNETNDYFETHVNIDVLPISTHRRLIPMSDSVASLLTRSKHRSLSSSSADGLYFAENLGSKPPKHPFHRGFVSSGSSDSIRNLNSEPNNTRIRRPLEGYSSAVVSQTQHEHERRNSHRSRRSLQCFSLNLDTFTEEFLEVQPASILDIANAQNANKTASTRDINIGNSSSQSIQLKNDSQMTNKDTSKTPSSPCDNASTQGKILSEIGKLNPSRCKLNLPVGRNRPGRRCDKKPFYFANSHNVDSSLSLATPNLTTTPTTTDSGYNTESSFSCEKTPKFPKVCDSPISEILYYNIVDEEDFEEPFSLSRSRSSDKINNNFKDDHSMCTGVKNDQVFDNLKSAAGNEENKDCMASESGRNTPALFLEEINVVSGEPASEKRFADSNGSTGLTQHEWHNLSRQINGWHFGCANTGQVNGDVAVAHTGNGRPPCDVNRDSFATKDGCKVNVCLRDCEVEEIKTETIADRNEHVSQARGMHVCDGQNTNTCSSGNEHLNYTPCIFDDESCTAQKEAKLQTQESKNDTQKDTDLEKRERKSRLEETKLELTSYSEEGINSTKHNEMSFRRQEEMNFTVRVRKPFSVQESTDTISGGLKPIHACQCDEDVCSKNSTSLRDSPSLWKANQEEKQCENTSKEEKSNNASTDSSSAQSGLCIISPSVKCETGRSGGSVVSSNGSAIANNGRHTFGKCVSSSNEVLQINISSAREGKTEANRENDLDNENDSEICPDNFAPFLNTDDSSKGDDGLEDLSDNGCKIELLACEDYSTNAGENSPPNGTKQDREAVFSLTNGERKGGNIATVKQDQSTIDNSTCVRRSSRDGNSCVWSRDGVERSSSWQTSRDTDQLKGFSGGFFSRYPGSEDKRREFCIVSCDEPISQNVSLLSNQLRNKAALCDFAKDRDIITANSTAQAEKLTILDSTSSNHYYSQIDTKSLEFTKDVFQPLFVWDDESISTHSLSRESEKIDSSKSEEWRCSTPCFRDDSPSPSLCLQNLARCFERIGGTSGQEEQQMESNCSWNIFTKDFSSSDSFTDKQDQSDSSARFFKESSQPDDFEAFVQQEEQQSVSGTDVDNLNPSNISGSFTEHVSLPFSSGKLVETLNQPIILGQFTERLSQQNSDNTCIEIPSHRESHKASVSHLAEPNISSRVVDVSRPNISSRVVEESRPNISSRVVNASRPKISSRVVEGSRPNISSRVVKTLRPNICSRVVKESSQVASSGAFKGSRRQRQDRLHKVLSISDSNLPNSLFTEALKYAADKKPPTARKKLAFGFPEFQMEHEKLLLDDDVHPLNEVNSYNVCGSKNYMASDCNLYFSNDTKSRGHRLYTCGSAGMLNSWYSYSDTVSNADFNVGGSYGKKVASCTNLAEQRSKYRSRIAMGMASARMRASTSPARNACTKLSPQNTRPTSPVSRNIPPENAITSTRTVLYCNPRHACFSVNSQNWKTASNTEGLKHGFPTPKHFVKHSRSLDMYIDREESLDMYIDREGSLDMYMDREGSLDMYREDSSVYARGHDQSRRVSEFGDQKPGRINISGQRRPSDVTQRYLSEPDDISSVCVGGYRLNQLCFKPPGKDFCTLASPSAGITTLSSADGVYFSSSCLNQPNMASDNPSENRKLVCTKDTTESVFSHSYHTAQNSQLPLYDQRCNIEPWLSERQLRNPSINSLDSMLDQQFSGESLLNIDSHSNNPPRELDNRATSESNDSIDTEYPSLHLQHCSNLTSDLDCAVMSIRDDIPSSLLEDPSALLQDHTDRIWNYNMTSLLEESTSADVMSFEAGPEMATPAADVCPSCRRPFDGGKKRRLVDSCGHERCYSCMFNSEVCSVCVAQAQTQRSSSRRTTLSSNNNPTRAKLNHCLTGDPGRASSLPEIPPRLRFPASPGILGPPPLPTKAKHVPQPGVGHPRQQSPVHYSNQSLTAATQAGCKSPVTMETWDLDREGDSPPPPPPDVAQHDLMMRLGLLLGDAIHPSGITGVGIVLPDNLQGEATLNSISSLSSNEHTPEKSASDASPMSTLTASSGAEFNMALPGPHIHPTSCSPVGNQDGSSPHHLIFQRPHTFTTSIPGANEDIALFGSSRSTSVRRSTRGSAIGRKYEPRTTKSDQLQLKPVVFEVPHPEGKPMFVGRAWLFSKLETVFGAGGCGAPDSNGVIITGAQGTGKTAIVEQLINHSCFSDDYMACNSAKPQDKLQSNQSHGTKLTDYTALNGLGFQVVAYHICQADNSATCILADMVSSMAAQMAKAPQLVAYRELLLQEPHLQTILSITECTQNPSLSFLKGILEPLRMLKNAGKIFTDCCIILVDSLNEAEFHKPDHGDTIASFLCRHASMFPHWLKLVVTVQSSFQEITSSLPFTRISLDQHGNNSDNVSRDIVSYIEHRTSISSTIRANIAVNGRPNKELTAKFTSHVQSLSNGSFLYAKLVLDLIESGHLVPKSSSYTILPVNLSEVFLLHFNLKFSSIRAYERVSTILAVCLASLYPLTLVDIFLTVNSGYVHQYLSWEEFSLRMDMLAGFVYSCHDNTVMFFHPAFREWLIHRNEGDCPKFLCDPRHGHALLAFRLSRVSAPLTPDKTVELGHHILKAHIYKSVSRQLGYSSQNVQAYWMCLSSHSLNAALVSYRNVYSPNVKVSRLILLSGGNPNSRTEYLSNAPVLCVAAREGYIDMLSLLLEFGADPNLTSDTGMSPLCHGAAGGHVEVMRMLCLHNARPSTQDVQGNSAAIHAVIHGQLEAVKFLMHLNWTVQPNEPTKDEVVTQCFVASAATGNTQILEYLHETYNGSRLNMVDSLLCETALTAACLHGRTLCVKFLLDSGADIKVPNARFFTPLLCAVRCGRWEVCNLLLASGADLEMTDQYGCTPLMMAAREGHTTVLTLLLEKGASQISTDKQGLTALCWACLQGHLSVVDSLVTHGSNVNHSDVNGRSPLHLAAMYGDVSVVQFLIDHKAQIEHTDLNGMRALDCAIVYNNIAVIICFLRKGAKLGPNTWSLAMEKTDILLLLLNKLTEDGSILYKKNRIKEASQRYQYALKKLPTNVRVEEVQTFQELKLSFLLNLSRCKRRMNDLQSAVDLATKALEVRPRCFEAYYARARARRDNRQYAAAQQDLIEALQLAPKNKELQRLLTRVKEECWEQMARYESGGREMASLEMDRIAEDDNDSLIVDNPVLYLPAV